MASWISRVCFALVFVGGIAVAAAQDSPPAGLPNLHLSPEQRQTIYQSVSSKPAEKSAAPDTFRAAIGANVPDTVKLAPMPKAVVDLIPQTKDFQTAYIANQVLIVEPNSRRVVEVITQTNG